GGRVVIGDAEDANTGHPRALNELVARQSAVRGVGVRVEIDQRVATRRRPSARGRPPSAPSRRRLRRRSAGCAALPLQQRLVLADQELEVRTLLLGELEEDLLSLGVLELLAVALEEPVGAAFAANADEIRLLIVDAAREPLGAFGETPAGRPFAERERGARFELRVALAQMLVTCL